MRILFFFLALVCQLSAQYKPKDYQYLIGMPGFSDALLQLHFKLYAGYVSNTNQLLAKIQSLSPSPEYSELKRRFGWEFNGMRLHELYFDNLGGDGQINPKSALYSALNSQFGSFDKWKDDFIATGSMRGIGWVVLCMDPSQKMFINRWVNEHDVGNLVTGNDLLIMDVFEHAYMPQYGLDKTSYIHAFFNNIDWTVVEKRYARQIQRDKP